MANPARIPVVRNWTERHAHKTIKLSEDEQGRVWLRLSDLRQWTPGLTSDRELFKTHPSRVALTDGSTAAYLEASAFAWLTQKSTNVPTLKLRAWLESSVVGPARQRHQWEDYRGRDPMRLHRDRGPARTDSAHEISEIRMPWQMRLNPRAWLITQGQWTLRRTLVAGAIASVLAVVISILLDNRAWEVESNYRLWTWMGIAMAVWAVLWNTAWGIGAIRRAARDGRDGRPVWTTSLWLLANLGTAMFAAGLTLSNTKVLVESWWIMQKEGDPPVSVLVASVDDQGRPESLLIHGAIGLGSTKALRAVLTMYPNVPEVELNSPGGLVVEGVGMTRLLHSAGVRTVVTKRCSSACTSMFLAGEERVIGAKARLGFHRSFSITGDFGSEWSKTDLADAEWMRSRGVREAFIQQALDTPGWDLWVPTHVELLGVGVATSQDVER